MFIKRFLGFFALFLVLVACTPKTGWYQEYDTLPTQFPSQIQNDFNYPEYNMYGRPEEFYTPVLSPDLKNVSVMLPLSGVHAELGGGISTSIEIAFLQRNYNNISVTFYDVSGNNAQKQSVILNALATQPDIIIGPIFAEDARLVRDLKPKALPVLSFSSDTNAFGHGVMTMALIPAQSVEEIIKEITRDNMHAIAVFAPDTQSGRRMAGTAVQAANNHDLSISGLFYYKEANSDSIKNATQRASMYTARTAANTRAREILSDILVKENITSEQRSSLDAQLEKLSKSDTLGKAPYDAVLFLGNDSDSKTIASFLRYFDVSSRDAQFYGTALWDSSKLLTDFTMAGAKFAALPAISPDFVKLYEHLSGRLPTRLDTFGFDATTLAIGMLYSQKSTAAYLLDPSGYNGMDGLFRLKPDGESERALQIMELNGSGFPRINRAAAKNFFAPLYTVQPQKTSHATEMDLVGDGVNPMNYIKIPDELKSRYTSKTFGAHTRFTASPPIQASGEITIIPEDDGDEIINSEEFHPIELEQIDRTLINSIELN